MTRNRRYDLKVPNALDQQYTPPTEAEIFFTPNTNQTDFNIPGSITKVVRAYANGILILPTDYELQGNIFKWEATGKYNLNPSIIIYIVYQL